MSETLICPDCHGVIGAAPGSDVQPCTCFSAAKQYVRPSEESIRRAEEAQAVTAAQVAAAVEKICRVCGKNLAGHRRLKDTLGYICLPCAKSEEEAAEAGMVRCGECGKRLKAAGLVDYHGTMVCKTCYADHQEFSKFKAPPPNLNAHMEEKRKSMRVTTIVLCSCLLLLLIIWLVR